MPAFKTMGYLAQMPSGHRKKGDFSWVECKGEPFPKKREKGAPLGNWAGKFVVASCFRAPTQPAARSAAWRVVLHVKALIGEGVPKDRLPTCARNMSMGQI